MRALVLLAIFVLLGCAEQRVAASDTEKEIARTNLATCLYDADGKIDDLTSDATTIAIGLVGTCGRDFEALDKVLYQQENLQVKALMAQNAMQRRIELATKTVLEIRSAARAAAQKKLKKPSGDQI
jgi:hypothetical protein